MKEAIVAPAPGKIPMRVPNKEDLKIVIFNLGFNLSHGRLHQGPTPYFLRTPFSQLDHTEDMITEPRIPVA